MAVEGDRGHQCRLKTEEINGAQQSERDARGACRYLLSCVSETVFELLIVGVLLETAACGLYCRERLVLS